MKTYVKIIMAGINIVCLIVTLLYPNTVTPISLLPVIVTTTSWVFLSKSDHTDEHSNHKRDFLVYSIVVFVLCMVLGVTSRITPSTNTGTYVISFYSETVLLSGLNFSYKWFAIAAFIAILIMIISEVVATSREERRHMLVKAHQSMQNLVKEALNSASSE